MEYAYTCTRMENGINLHLCELGLIYILWNILYKKTRNKKYVSLSLYYFVLLFL